MKKNKNAFSLIEVLIATWILSIAVFWVYKLIWENTKIISNSDNYLLANNIIIPLKECIKNIWFDTFKSSNNINYSFNFWENSWTWCFTWTLQNVILNNIEYQLTWNITDSWATYIDWELWVFSDLTWDIKKNYKQVK